jgi:CheY-like chemotaxis protein
VRILVVEDDPLVREVAVEALTDEGYEVVEAETGEQALEHCRKQAADLIFTDIRLPGEVNGWDVAELCRETNPRIPIVYATGHSHVRPRPVSGSIWFQKPYRPVQLVQAIKSLSGN